MTPRPRTAHRELTDFLAFALAIVFLVRTFVGEPFGVPTGSMAPTLLGAHKLIHCPECNKTFPVGADDPANEPVVCQCPACGTKLDIAAAPVKSGNRIVVMKGPPTPLKRWDVAVFKFIDEPQKFYVKRIVGLPGERLRIRGGEIEIWNESGQRWHIARKPAELAKQLAIPVWEEEYQKKGGQNTWRIKDIERVFRRLSPAGNPLLIGDDIGYNFGLPLSQSENANVYSDRAGNPVSDLHVSFTVAQQDMYSPAADVQINQGNTKALLKTSPWKWSLHVDGSQVEAWKPSNTWWPYSVHFAFVDRRLAVWHNERLVRELLLPGESEDSFPTTQDSEPIQIVKGVPDDYLTNLRVYRDVYYTQQVGATDFLATDAGREMMGDAKQFKRFRDARQRTTEFTVPAGSYFALGDNSIRSHDGRHWQRSHFVSERMFVGRVLFKLGR